MHPSACHHPKSVPPAAHSRRTLFLAIALSLLIPSPVRAQDSLQRAASVRAIVRLEPSAFADLPAAVRGALTARGCVIPQTGWPELASQPHNAAGGRFTSSQRRDWAVLCSRRDENVTYVLILHGRTGRRIDSLASAPLSGFLLPRGTDRWIFVREISAVAPAAIREMAEPHGDPLPRCLDHDGLKDSFADDWAILWYKLEGRWLDLIGGTTLGERRRAMYARPCRRSGRRAP